MGENWATIVCYVMAKLCWVKNEQELIWDFLGPCWWWKTMGLNVCPVLLVMLVKYSFLIGQLDCLCSSSCFYTFLIFFTCHTDWLHVIIFQFFYHLTLSGLRVCICFCRAHVHVVLTARHLLGVIIIIHPPSCFPVRLSLSSVLIHITHSPLDYFPVIIAFILQLSCVWLKLKA